MDKKPWFVRLFNRSPEDCLQLTGLLCIAELQPQSLLALKWRSSPNTLMLNAILIEHSNSFFTEINKMVLTFIGKCRRHRVAKQPWEGKTKLENSHFWLWSSLSCYSDQDSLEQRWEGGSVARTETPETDSRVWQDTSPRKTTVFSTNNAGQLDIPEEGWREEEKTRKNWKPTYRDKNH